MIKSAKNVFFVLTFVAIFLKLIIAQLTVYAHFKDFFLCDYHESNKNAARSSRRVVMDPFLTKVQKIANFFDYKTDNIFGSNYLPEIF